MLTIGPMSLDSSASEPLEGHQCIVAEGICASLLRPIVRICFEGGARSVSLKPVKKPKGRSPIHMHVRVRLASQLHGGAAD